MIIGANNFQRPLIQKAKELGIETHVFAWEKGSVGREYADHFYPISIIEKDRILDKARKINPDGVVSIASDLAIITVNHIANKLGLAGNSLECTHVTTDKLAMRRCLSQGGLPCPRYSDSADIHEILDFCGEFPLIVKPQDRSGSRGVTMARDTKDLRRAIERSRSESFSSRHIAEQFIPGREYSVEMISRNGEHHFIQITEKETSGEPYFVEMAHHQPADLSVSQHEKIISIVKQALSCLGIENGASHSEMLLTDKEDVFIVEIGARMGGDYIGSHLVEMSTGYDYLKGAIDIAIGHFNGAKRRHVEYSGIQYVSSKPGKLKRVVNKALKYPEILFNEVYYKIGDNVREVRESNDRAACYIYHSKSGKFAPTEEIIVLE